MKKTMLCAALMAFAFSCEACNADDDGKGSERLTYFQFDHHNSMSQSGERYEVSTTKDGRVHVVIDEGFPEELDFYLDDATIFDELLPIVKAYKMDKYKESYRPMMDITDGDSWSLYYRYDSKRSVSSGGYMAWPRNYHEARSAISEYFKKWRDYQNGKTAIDYFLFSSKNNKGVDILYSMERGETAATVILRDAQRAIDTTFTVSNDLLPELQKMTHVVRLKSDLYNYNTDDPDATRCTYFVRYSTGDTLSGSTCYVKYPGPKERGISAFFSQWLP